LFTSYHKKAIVALELIRTRLLVVFQLILWRFSVNLRLILILS